MKQPFKMSTGFRSLSALAMAGCGANDGSSSELAERAEAAAKAESALAQEQAQVTLTAAQDTTVLLSKPNQNFGSLPTLDVNRALVQFSSATLTAAVGHQDLVVSAKLNLTLTNNKLRVLPRKVGASRLTRAWTETGATWNCAADDNISNHRPDCASRWSMGVLPPNPWASPATSVIAVPAATTGVVSFDVTADVQQFVHGTAPNNGWMLLGSTPGEFAEFAARESSTPPQLVLTIKRCSASLCDDGNACTTDSCDASANCAHSPAADGTGCNDGNACTQTDVCQAGTCSGQNPVTCSAVDACHLAGSCDPSNGACSRPLAPLGTHCADGNVCDAAGSCVQCFTASTCPGTDDACGARTCTNGACGTVFAPEGTECGAGFECNGAGACEGVPHVTVNEVESSGGTPGDWVELYNAGPAPADVSGWKFLDNDDTHTPYVIPKGTVIAAGGYYVLEEAAFGFGLGAADSARLFDSTGALTDSHNWTAHASTTYGRCPNGSGAFATTATVSKGLVNECGTTTPPAPVGLTWPGSATISTADELNALGANLSGLSYEPGANGSPSVLWAVRNGPSLLHRLVWNGSLWTPDTANGWNLGKTLRYNDGTGGPDSEGVTLAEYSSPFAYVATERNNDVSATSRLSVLRYDTSVPGSELVAELDWNLTADLPTVGSNVGLEAITFVPDSYLVARAFFDEGAGHTYNPLEYPGHGTGLFFVGIEANGVIYAYALNQLTGSFVRIATIASGNSGVMDLQFDRDAGYLWAQCDDTCNNLAGILTIDTNAASATFGRFVVKQKLARPAGMPNLNNEGIAFAPEAECVNGFKPFFWADDSNTDGHALRSGTIACGALLP